MKPKKPELPQELQALFLNGLKAFTQPLEERITELELQNEKLVSQIQASEGLMKTIKDQILKELSSHSSHSPNGKLIFVQGERSKAWLLRTDFIAHVEHTHKVCKITFGTPNGPVLVTMTYNKDKEEVAKNNWKHLFESIKNGTITRLPQNDPDDYDIKVGYIRNK